MHIRPFYLTRSLPNLISKRDYAGHSKWANIRHTKAAIDKKRGAEFAKIGLELIAAIKAGGIDPQFNLRLAAALTLAKAKDFPKKNLENCFKKATGKTDEPLEEVCFMGMGPHSLAVVIEAVTSSRNRTVKSIRSLLTRAGGSITDVAWMFEKKGKILINRTTDSDKNIDVDQITEDVIMIGGEDFQVTDDKEIEVICSFTDLGKVSKELSQMKGYEMKSIAPYYQPTSLWVPPEGDETTLKTVQEELEQFLDNVESLEEVVRVHTNLPQE